MNKEKATIFQFYGPPVAAEPGWSVYNCLECTRKGKSKTVRVPGKTTSNLITHLERQDHYEVYQEYQKAQEFTSSRQSPAPTNKKRKLFDSPHHTPSITNQTSSTSPNVVRGLLNQKK
jgi:hypothetical protein